MYATLYHYSSFAKEIEHFNTIYIEPIITAIESRHLNESNTGLGNVLFQIASVYGIASTLKIGCSFNNVVVYCDKLKKLFNYDHGKTILRNVINQTSPVTFTKVIEQNERTVDTILMETIKNSSQHLVIQGYLEHVDYFHHEKEHIRSMFGMDEKSKSYISTTYPFLFTSNTVCIHFRYGKDIQNMNKDLNYPYYKKSIESIRNQCENPYFLLFSDNHELIDYSLFNSPSEYKIIKEKYDYIELWIMSLCKHYILSGSTFSWWGCYLNKNREIVLSPESYPSWHSVRRHLKMPTD